MDGEESREDEGEAHARHQLDAMRDAQPGELGIEIRDTLLARLDERTQCRQLCLGRCHRRHARSLVNTNLGAKVAAPLVVQSSSQLGERGLSRVVLTAQSLGTLPERCWQ